MLLDNSFNVNCIIEEHVTPLHTAFDSRRERIVRLLLVRGANVRARDTEGRNALHRLSGYYAKAKKAQEEKLLSNLSNASMPEA